MKSILEHINAPLYYSTGNSMAIFTLKTEYNKTYYKCIATYNYPTKKWNPYHLKDYREVSDIAMFVMKNPHPNLPDYKSPDYKRN